VQKKAIRLITKGRYNAHTGPLFKLHNILPYDKIRLQSELHLMRAVEYKYAPSSFDDILTTNAARHADHDIKNNELYNLPLIDWNYLEKFLYTGYLLNGTRLATLLCTTTKFFLKTY
jgi:hypothetical protein